MKLFLAALNGLLLAYSVSARDFRPVGWLENVPASDTSVQQCYVFRTVPGVIYQIESSGDLTTWSAAGEKINGLGHE